MQNYNNTVAAVIQHYATQIANSAQDSINENNDYCIIDNCAKMEFLLLASADYATVAATCKRLLKQQNGYGSAGMYV